MLETLNIMFNMLWCIFKNYWGNFTLADTPHLIWFILGVFWQGFMWLWQFEEMWASTFDDWGWSSWQQLVVLLPFNTLMIAVETAIFSLFKPAKFEIPRFLSFISRSKALDYPGWALLGFIPHCQKFGSYFFARQLKRCGWKYFLPSLGKYWRNYLAICVGGTCRLIITVYIPAEYLKPLIAGMVVVRLVTWWFDNNHASTKAKT